LNLNPIEKEYPLCTLFMGATRVREEEVGP